MVDSKQLIVMEKTGMGDCKNLIALEKTGMGDCKKFIAMKNLPPVTTCCGCLTVRTASMVIAVFSLISSAFCIAYLTYGLILFIVTGENQVGDVINYNQTEAGWEIYAAILFHAVRVLFCIMLLVGIVKNKTGLLCAWIGYKSVDIGLEITFFLVIFVFLAISKNFMAMLGVFFMFGLSLALSLYSLMVVRSSYRVMAEEKRRSLQPQHLQPNHLQPNHLPPHHLPAQLQASHLLSKC